MSAKGLSKGDRVLISGMLQAVHLNGKSGIVAAVLKSKKIGAGDVANVRYGIQVDGEKEPVAIKLSNWTLETSMNETVDGPRFQIGDSVVLHSLVTATFNGRYGRILTGHDPLNGGRYCVGLEKGGKMLKIKPKNIRLYVKNTEELKTERNRIRDANHPTEIEVADVNTMAFLRMMTLTCGEEEQIKMFGRRIEAVPDFRAEVQRDGGFPIAVDSTWANNHLSQSYECASSLPHLMEMQFKDPDYIPQPKEVMRRLCSPQYDKLQWYYSDRAMGDIYTGAQDRVYTGSVRHNYSNQAYRREILQLGKTHVAVGFVDLGFLMAAELREGDDWNRVEPLHFIGVERSSFAVAKAHVIWQLIRECASTPDGKKVGLINSVLQVWYSSTWTSDTEHAVRRALDVLCQAERSYHHEVRQTLEHWRHAPAMSLKVARKAHVDRTSGGRSKIGILKIRMDRVAMLVRTDRRLCRG